MQTMESMTPIVDRTGQAQPSAPHVGAGQRVKEYLFIKPLESKEEQESWLVTLSYGEAQFRADVFSPKEAQQVLVTAQALARLRLPNVLPVLDCFVHEGAAFVITPCIQHATLRSVLAEKGPLGLMDAVGISSEVADALSASHKAGIVHGNLDMDAVCFDRRGMALVQRFAPGGPPGGRDPRSDVHGLGRLLGTMLAGKDLAASPILPSLALRAMRPDIPESLIGIIERAMGSSGTSRFQSCAEMSIYLELERISLQTSKRRNPATGGIAPDGIAIPPPLASPALTVEKSTTALARLPSSHPGPDMLPRRECHLPSSRKLDPSGLEGGRAKAREGVWHSPAEGGPSIVASDLGAGVPGAAEPGPERLNPEGAPSVLKSSCEQCQKTLNPGAHFCIACGRRTPHASLRRASLLKVNAANLRFCNQCGKPLARGRARCLQCSQELIGGGERHAMPQLPI